MAPNNQSGRRINRPVRATKKSQKAEPALTATERLAIQKVMVRYERHGPKRVHAELRRTRHDITLDKVQAVFREADRERVRGGVRRL